MKSLFCCIRVPLENSNQMPATAVNASQPRFSKVNGGNDFDQFFELEPNNFVSRRQSTRKVSFVEDALEPSRPRIDKEVSAGEFFEAEPLSSAQEENKLVCEFIKRALDNSQMR